MKDLVIERALKRLAIPLLLLDRREMRALQERTGVLAVTVHNDCRELGETRRHDDSRPSLHGALKRAIEIAEGAAWAPLSAEDRAELVELRKVLDGS